MSSPGAFREFVKGLRDGGEVTLEINYAPANATHKNASGGLLAEYLGNDNTRNWKLIFSDAANTEWAFTGFVKSFEVSAPVDDLLTASVTIKVSGQPTLV